ncbi:MAG: hypothetical protein M1818_002207 [Claussenomyces sp. TS43310]|nr:MAG: hypothetical protein M1818_002207 [Claussenomyces sp. TS43310]
MPPWGRPSGAKEAKQRRRWERDQALRAEHIRIEELDSDDTDTQGIGYEKRRFVSDPLRFTGIDLSSKSMSRRDYAFDETDSDSDSEDDGIESAQQLALRDKEEALVQSALARIRRAQEKGKLEVKLNQDEVEALERRRRRLQSAGTTSKSKKGSGSSGGSENERRRRSDRAMVTVPIMPPEARRRSGNYRQVSPPASPRNMPAMAPPGMRVEGPEGAAAYVPIGYGSVASARGSPTRPRSSSSLHRGSQRTSPPVPYQAYSSGVRHVSEGNLPTSSTTSRRTLPDEEGWLPGSRRSSASSQTHAPDPLEYHVDSGAPLHLPSQYSQMHPSGRRHLSGPTEISYSSVRRVPPTGGASFTSARSGYVYPYGAAAASSSDPTLSRRRGREGVEVQVEPETETSSDDSDDMSHGARVEPDIDREVTPGPAPVPRRKPVGGKKKGRR